MRTWFICGILLLILLVACCGCATDTKGTPGTPTVTPVTTTSAPTQGVTSSPGVTQTMPPGKELIFDVRRDQIQPTITVTFRGGAGQFQVREILVTMISSEGREETKQLESKVGSEVTFQGTRAQDRIVIRVELITSEKFTVMNQLYDFYSHA